MLELRALRSIVLSIATVIMTNTGFVEAQTVNWFPATGPQPRASLGLVFDRTTHTTVLFGGAGDAGKTYGDTWLWLGGWLHLSPATSPSARQGHAMAYDEAAGNVVLFGGCSNNSPTCTYLNDTWTWDGSTWTQQFPASAPSPRVAYMAYDAATKTVVLFGGSNSASLLGDTWTWDGVAKTWTQQNPDRSPAPRLTQLAYDPPTESIVLFGGGIEHPPASGGTAFGDTWTWDGTTWTQQSPASSPSARLGAGIAFDPGLGAVVLCGGAVGGNWTNSAEDTWTWNGTNWTQIFPSTAPPNRYYFGMSYNPIAKAIVMFGGFSTAAARGGPWLLGLAP